MSIKNPWKIDADNINFRNIEANEIYDRIVKTPIVEEYLQYGHDDTKLIVVAPKGLGKTLLLKAKRIIYQEKAKSYRCLPSGTELVEKLVNLPHSFPKELLESFKQREHWELIWELSIYCWIFKEFELELPDELNKELRGANNLYNIVLCFLRSRNSITKFQIYIPQFLSPPINSLGPIAIFIDNVDEGLEQHIGEGLRVPHSKNVSEEVWINAQVGLMHVIRNLCSRNKHLKIFASVRSEAANCDRSQTSAQLRNDLCLDLSYSKRQIKQIFQKYIERTPIEKLKTPGNSDLITSFIGFSKLNHKFAKDKENLPREENVFDFIFRHTFGRPRDIITIGLAIYNIDIEERNEDDIREVVNKKSGDILDKYKDEVVPFFRDDVFESFCEIADKNVISREKKEEINKEIFEKFNFPNIFTHLYSLGLVGTIINDAESGKQYQSFLPAGEHASHQKKEPRTTQYYVLHSVIDRTLRDLHNINFYDKNNIIGNGYEFFPPSNSKGLHVHFGLTRDSLTLILPELNKNKSIIIFQETAKEHHELANFAKLIIETNLYPSIDFKIINKNFNKSQIQDAFGNWLKGENTLIYSNTDNADPLIPYLDACQTITIEGNSKLPTKVWEKINTHSPKKILYLCQRFIHKDSLQKIEQIIKDNNLNDVITIEPSLIDRLALSELEFEKQDSIIFYRIKSENFGKIICREREGSENEHNSIIRRTKSKDEQTFYELRQKFLVEGIYRLLKIVKSELPKKDRNNISLLYKIFFDVQKMRLFESFDNSVIQSFFPNRSDSEIVKRLEELFNESKDRFVNLEKFPSYTNGVDSYISEAKKLGIFPTDEEFYQYVAESDYFTNNAAVRKLQDLLNIKPLTNFRKVFVSFSAKDKEFAKKISDCLKKRGVNTYFYLDDYRHGEKKEIERKEIELRDRFLFIASEYSLKSEECHQELSLAIEKKKKLINEGKTKQHLKDIFIPLDLDGFLFKEEIEIKNIIEGCIGDSKNALDNIKILKNSSACPFNRYKSKKTNKVFEEYFDQRIVTALKKKKEK